MGDLPSTTEKEHHGKDKSQKSYEANFDNRIKADCAKKIFGQTRKLRKLSMTFLI